MEVMKILGIDYGLKKIGLSLAITILAEPYQVLRYEKEIEILEKIQKIIEDEKIEKVILGISEGEMGEKTKEFGEKLKQRLNIPLEFFDETLSTYHAQVFSREAGIKRSKRKSMEDAFAAAVMLQSYLDTL